MTNRTLTDEIITIIQSVANNNTAPTLATITKIYNDNYIDAKLPNGTYKYIQSIGEPKIDDTVIIAYTEDNTPIAINNTSLTDYYTKEQVDELISQSGGGGGIHAVGYFHINDNGHLIVEIPTGMSNPYTINENGHLIYNTGAT